MIIKSLQISKTEWKVSILGEKALLLEPKTDQDCLSDIHKVTAFLEAKNLKGISDLIPAYQSLGIIYDHPVLDINKEIDVLQELLSSLKGEEVTGKTHIVPVCYELGLDWNEVEGHTSMTKDEIIQRHMAGKYSIAMMGFIPGFVYLKGLDPSLSCPRKKNPRAKLPAGSVGIGGSQSGIYSLESPGGWQIIGQTPVTFFDPQKEPPVTAKPGDIVVFESITAREFEKCKRESTP